MPSISFVFRPSKKLNSTGTLFLRIIHQRKVRTVTLPYHLYTFEWDIKEQSVIFPRNDPDRIRELEKISQEITKEYLSILEHIKNLEKGGRYSVEDIIFHYRLKKDNGKLFAYVTKLCFTLEQNKQTRLARAYRTVMEGLINFNKGKDIPLAHINSCLINDFESYLIEKGKSPNTISFYMRNHY